MKRTILIAMILIVLSGCNLGRLNELNDRLARFETEGPQSQTDSNEASTIRDERDQLRDKNVALVKAAQDAAEGFLPPPFGKLVSIVLAVGGAALGIQGKRYKMAASGIARKVNPLVAAATKAARAGLKATFTPTEQKLVDIGRGKRKGDV